MKTYEVHATNRDGTWERQTIQAADVTWNENGPLFLWADKWGNRDSSATPNEAVAGFAPGQWSMFRVLPEGEVGGNAQ